MRISMKKSQKSLAIVWFIGAGFIILLVLLQSIWGFYIDENGDRTSEAWGWLLPTIMPTLSLIIGVLVAGALEKNEVDKTVDRFIYRLAMFLSIAYLIIVILPIIFSQHSETETIELMKRSNLWLGPFQGLVSASLGVFFINRKEK